MKDAIGHKAARLAHFIYMLRIRARISRTSALNALDRLACRLESKGETQASEYVSKIFMYCY